MRLFCLRNSLSNNAFMMILLRKDATMYIIKIGATELSLVSPGLYVCSRGLVRMWYTSPGIISIKKLQVYFISQTLTFWQVHTNLNPLKVFTSSSYKPPTCTYNGILLNSIVYELNLSNVHRRFGKTVCSFSTLEFWNFYFVILRQISVISNYLLNEYFIFDLLCNLLGHMNPFSDVSNIAIIKC